MVGAAGSLVIGSGSLTVVLRVVRGGAVPRGTDGSEAYEPCPRTSRAPLAGVEGQWPSPAAKIRSMTRRLAIASLIGIGERPPSRIARENASTSTA